MIKVLVTGSNGQLGKSIQKICQTFPALNLVFVSSKELDITDYKKLKSFFAKHNFDYCINCAAYTDVEQAEKTPEPAFLVNAEAVKNLAMVCKERNIVCIQLSTDYVFDGRKNTPYITSDPTNPINEYGKSKLKGEVYIQEILNRFFIIRTSWLYNKEYGKNFYRTILDKAAQGIDLQITDQQIGNPTNTDHLAKFILDLIDKDNQDFGIYHFTDGESMSWFDFAKKILKENHLSDKIKLIRVRHYQTVAARPKYSVLK